jgi:hypothetical protein
MFKSILNFFKIKISKLINYSIDICGSCRSTMVAMKCSIFNGNFKGKPKSMGIFGTKQFGMSKNVFERQKKSL